MTKKQTENPKEYIQGRYQPNFLNSRESGNFRPMGLLNNLLNLIYPGKQYGKRAATRSGVKVRSQAEERIANYFDSIGLRFEYEKELLAGLFLKEAISQPDFYLPDHDVYVEYWGMLDIKDDLDREKYSRSMNYKLARYRELGIKLISLYPDDLKNLDRDFRQKFQEATGTDLP